MNFWKRLAARRRFAAGSFAVVLTAGIFAAGAIAATGSFNAFTGSASSVETTTTTDTTATTTDTTATTTDTTATTTDTTTTTTDTTPTTTDTTTTTSTTSSTSCIATGTEAISTDQASYAPGETVHITGTGFGALCAVSVRITLPDSSTSIGGETTGADGALSREYAIPSGVSVGTFSVDVLDDGGSALASASFNVTSAPAAVACSAIGSESVSTDKPSYTAGETAHISGGGFGLGCDVVVRITLPGGSTTTLNTSTGGGDFALDYTTPGAPAPTGTFSVDVLGLADAVLASTTFETVAGVLAQPSVSSNKADYDPGEWVTLSGAGWQPAEHVHVVVNDDIGQTWSHVADVTASGGGTFTAEFQLPNAFVADYSVTATGDLSGTATTTFTDAQTSYAEGSGTWTGTCSNPTNALTNDNNRAACEPSGEYVDGQGFGLDSLVAADATGMSFTVFVNGQAQSNDNTDVWRVSLSWNGGTNFTSTTDSTDVFGSSGSDADAFIPSSTTCSTFGRTWTYSELSNANFRVRVAAIPDTGSGESMSIDDIDVRVCYGDYSINASVAGGTSAVASPSAAIPAAVEVQHTNASGTSNWNSTKYQVEGQLAVCVDHGQNSDSGSGTDTERFNITAPSAHGTYDVTFTPYEDDGCSTGTFAPITLSDAVTVGIFGDSFGITGPDTVPGWTDSDGSGSNAALRTRTGIIDPNGYVRLRGSGVVTSYQEGTGPWTGSCASPSDAVTSDNVRALCDSGENVVGSGFGLDSLVPAGASNISVKVRVEGRVTDTSGADVFGVQLSWNGGSNYTGTTNTGEVDSNFSSSDETNTAPSSEESCGTFGRTWSASELTDANFRVRVAAAPSTSTDDMDIDDIDVLVCFDGPNSVTKSGISTAGLGNIHLMYKWGQEADNDGDGAGDLNVQWKRSADSTWIDVNTHNLVDNSTTNPTTPEDESLGSSAGNTSIDIRFLGNTPETDDRARVDDVIVTGDVQAQLPSDAPTVDSPICAGATSVSGTSTEANGTSIEVFKNGVSVGTTTVTGGTWTKSSLSALVAGDQIKARATASGETVSADSNVVTVVTCDTSVDQPTLISPANGSTIGDNTPAFDWSDVTDPSTPVSYTLQYVVKGGSCDFTSATTVASLSSSTHTPASSIGSDGTYCWRVKAFDGIGNDSGYTSAFEFGLDTGAPLTGSVNDGSAADIDYQSSTSQLESNWTGFSDSGSGIDHYDYGASTSNTCTGNVVAAVGVGTNTSNTASSLTLANGTTYYNCVRAVDGVGNPSAWVASDGVTVDTSAPLTGSVNDGSAADIDYQSSTSQLESNWTGFSDSGSGIDHYDYGASTSNTCTGNVVAAVGVGTNTSNTASSLTLANGTTYYNCVRAVDGVGNPSAWVASDGVTVDTNPPTSTITFPVNGTSYNETGFKAGCSTATTSDVCGTSTDGASGVNKVELSLQRSSDSKWWDGSTWVTSGTEVFVEADNTTWSYALLFSNLINDAYTLHVRGTDNAGNVESSPVVSFTIDTLAPTVTIVSAVPNPVIVPTHSNTVVTWNADENGTYSVRVGGTSCTTGTQVASGSYTAPSDTTTTIGASSLAYGANTIRVCVTDAATNVGSNTITVYKKALTSLLYNGQDVVAVGGSLILGAKLSSANAGCSVSGRTIHFTVEDVTTGVDYTVDGTTDASGQATVTVPGATTAGWDLGPLFTDADFDATATCTAAHGDGVVTVTTPGQAATGGGWYTLTGNGRLNFGFNVRLVPGTGTGPTNPPQYKGKLLLNNNGKWRLKGDLTSYAKINSGATCPGSNCKGSANGTGKLYLWDQTLNGGVGDWSLVSSSVTFAVSFTDASQGGGKKSNDAFGIIISYSVSGSQPPLPNSSQTVLKGGDISIK